MAASPNPGPATAEGIVLAFDFGTRRIGVAIGNTLLRDARPLAAIDAPATAQRFAAIAELVDEWQPCLLVVGRPVHMDGTVHEMTARSERFARQLEGRFRLPVRFADERGTTGLARPMAGASGVRGRGARDAVAAQLILQSYFDQPTTETGSAP